MSAGDGRPDRDPFPRIAIVGTGRLGASLALGLARGGRRVVAVCGRDAGRTHRLAEIVGTRACLLDGGELATVLDFADVVILAVPDGAIAPLAADLSWRTGQAAVHCSGALGLDALAEASRQGVLAGCLHPLQSFSSLDGEPERFRGVTCGIEGDEPLGGWLEAVAYDLGARTVRLEGVDRALYHAAAVFASNDAVALASAAARAWALAGLPPDEARTALATLLLGAASNIANRPLEDALTGPVKRGDAGTVERHIEALATAPDLLDLYRRLGAELLRLDLGLSPDVEARLRDLLTARPQ